VLHQRYISLDKVDPSLDFWEEWLGENSLVIEEGKYRLAEEFGSEQGTIFQFWRVSLRVKRVAAILSRF